MTHNISVPQEKSLDTLHVNHMDIDNTRLLACESIYRININIDIENATNNFPVCLDFQVTQPKDKMLPCEIPEDHRNVSELTFYH